MIKWVILQDITDLVRKINPTVLISCINIKICNFELTNSSIISDISDNFKGYVVYLSLRSDSDQYNFPQINWLIKTK